MPTPPVRTGAPDSTPPARKVPWSSQLYVKPGVTQPVAAVGSSVAPGTSASGQAGRSCPVQRGQRQHQGRGLAQRIFDRQQRQGTGAHTLCQPLQVTRRRLGFGAG
jgi:hypothetical protein